MDIGEDIKELVISKGFKVAMSSDYCKFWKKDHKNCVGCECENGCARYVRLLGIMTSSMIYKPTFYKDFEEMNKSIQVKMSKILDVNTTKEELKTIW